MSSFCISAHGHRYIQPGAHWPRVARIVINGADNIYRLYFYIPTSSGWSSLVRFCAQGEGIYHNDSLRKGGSWRIELVDVPVDVPGSTGASTLCLWFIKTLRQELLSLTPESGPRNISIKSHLGPSWEDKAQRWSQNLTLCEILTPKFEAMVKTKQNKKAKQ